MSRLPLNGHPYDQKKVFAKKRAAYGRNFYGENICLGLVGFIAMVSHCQLEIIENGNRK